MLDFFPLLIASGFADVGPAFLRDFMVSVAATLATALCIKQLFFAPKTPQPLVTSKAIEYATVGQIMEMKTDVHNQIKDMRSYLHTEMHGIQGELKSIYASQEQRTREVLGKEAFSDYRTHADRDRQEIKESLKDLMSKVEKFGSENYRARKEMHRTINAHSNALSYMAAQHEQGAKIHQLLKQGVPPEES
jgi:gas vesicle protein